MIHSKRSQAAMDFLLSYGWALVVIIAAVATLAYFGVLEGDIFSPKYCLFPTGLSCRDHALSTDGDIIQVQLKNNLGGPISNVQVSLPFSTCVPWTSSSTISNDQTFTIQLTNCAITDGKAEMELDIQYTRADTGLFFNDVGIITGRVGSGSGGTSTTTPPTTPTDCADVICTAKSVNNNMCQYTNLVAGSTGPLCNSPFQCDGSGDCVECLIAADCPVHPLLGGTPADWQCVNNVCEPVVLFSDDLYSGQTGTLIDSDAQIGTSGHYIRFTGLGITNDNCYQITSTGSPSPWSGKNFFAELTASAYFGADSDTCTSGSCHLFSSATYFTYINQCACSKSIGLSC